MINGVEKLFMIFSSWSKHFDHSLAIVKNKNETQMPLSLEKSR